MSGLLPIKLVAELCNVGTLFAFIVATSGLLVMRKRLPDLHRPFVCPAAHIVVPVAVISCLYIMYSLPNRTLILFACWVCLGILVYALYGYKHSRLRAGDDS